MLIQKQIKKFLNYDPEIGIFTRKINTGRFKAGEIAGTDRNGYTIIGLENKLYRAHRLAWLYVYGVMPTKSLDHKDGNKKNNKINNLREVTQLQNTHNRFCAGKNNKSTQKIGVFLRKDTEKFQARITVNYKQITIGCFNTVEAAHAAYLEAKNKYHCIPA